MLHYCATILCLGFSLGSCDKHGVQIQTPGSNDASTFVTTHGCITHSPRPPLEPVCEVAPGLSKSRLVRWRHQHYTISPCFSLLNRKWAAFRFWRGVVFKGLLWASGSSITWETIRMQTFRPHPRSIKLETLGGAQQLVVNKHSRWFE